MARVSLVMALILVALLVSPRPTAADGPRPVAWLGAVEAYEAPEPARALGIGWQRVNFWWNQIQPRPPGPPRSDADVRFFPETGHGVAGAFRRFFETRGDLEIFGYPISDELSEANGRRVQQFQRMRLEYHPEHAGTPDEFQLGLVGDEYLRQAGRLE